MNAGIALPAKVGSILFQALGQKGLPLPQTAGFNVALLGSPGAPLEILSSETTGPNQRFLEQLNEIIQVLSSSTTAARPPEPLPSGPVIPGLEGLRHSGLQPELEPVDLLPLSEKPAKLSLPLHRSALLARPPEGDSEPGLPGPPLLQSEEPIGAPRLLLPAPVYLVHAPVFPVRAPVLPTEEDYGVAPSPDSVPAPIQTDPGQPAIPVTSNVRQPLVSGVLPEDTASWSFFLPQVHPTTPEPEPEPSVPPGSAKDNSHGPLSSSSDQPSSMLRLNPPTQMFSDTATDSTTQSTTQILLSPAVAEASTAMQQSPIPLERSTVTPLPIEPERTFPVQHRLPVHQSSQPSVRTEAETSAPGSTDSNGVSDFSLSPTLSSTTHPKEPGNRSNLLQPQTDELSINEEVLSQRTGADRPSIESLSQIPAQTPRETGTEVTQPKTRLVEEVARVIVESRESADITRPIEVRLHLDPPDLGIIRVRLSLVEDRLNVQILIREDGTRQLFEHHLPQLREKIDGSGIALDSFNVGSDDEGTAGQWLEQEPTWTVWDDERSEQEKTQVRLDSPPSSRFGSDTIDLLA